MLQDTDGGALVPTNQFITFTRITDRMVLIVTDKQLVRYLAKSISSFLLYLFRLSRNAPI